MAESALHPPTDLAEKRRILQLETLYDIALALHAHRPEPELVDELLQQVCAAVDPAAAVAVTRGPYGDARANASVGWQGERPDGATLFGDPLWRELLTQGGPVSRRDGTLAGRRYRELVATPFVYRSVFLGYLAVLDKEARGGGGSGFTGADRRFLDSVAVMVGVALDSLRQLESLTTERERLEEENRALKGRLLDDLSDHRIVAHAPAMRRILEMVERVAPRNVSVLLRGESGTGKELVAKLLHSLSGRSGPLVAINCAALPEALLESELFGIEGGVATGVQARRGKFELADGGSLFLDEIGDLQVPLQVKLLRVLQEREVTPIGGRQAIPIDVRVVAATHRDLAAMVAAGTFREDLYYRLKVVEIELPALRERRQDVAALVRHFAEEFARREGIEAPHFDAEALALLLRHDYPGNVRELQNLVEGAAALADGPIGVELLRSLIGGAGEDETGGGDDSLSLETVERRHVERVLRLAGGNKSVAARMLGVDRRTLQRKGF